MDEGQVKKCVRREKWSLVDKVRPDVYPSAEGGILGKTNALCTPENYSAF